MRRPDSPLLSPKRPLYRIQSHREDPLQAHYHTGTLPDGTQVLMGLLLPFTVGIFFDPMGCYAELRCRLLPDELFVERNLDDIEPRPGERWLTAAVRDMWEREYAVRRAMLQWKDSLGVVPGPITVQPFDAQPWGLYLLELPEHWLMYLEDPERLAQEPLIQEWLKVWQEKQMFSLYFPTSYNLDVSGRCWEQFPIFSDEVQPS